MTAARVPMLAVVAWLCAGCPAPRGSHGPASAQSSRPADDTVLEAVLLHEIAAARPTSAEALCLRVRSATNAVGDASGALVAAIGRRYATAVAGSACSGGGPQPVRLTASGAAAVMFDIGPVAWTGSVAIVEGGGGNRGGSLHIREVAYRVEPRDGQLRVASERVVRQN